MGCGLIALSLWLYFLMVMNVSSDIKLISPFIVYSIMIWGISSILRRYNNKYLKYSLSLSIIYLLFIFVEDILIIYIVNCILAVLQLYTLFKGIQYISKDYIDIDIFNQKVSRYLIIVLITNLFIMNMAIYNTDKLFAEGFVILFMFFTTKSISKHLIRINDYLYMQFEPIKEEHVLPRNKKYKRIAVLILILSIFLFMFGQLILPDMIYKYSHEVTTVVLEGKSENIILENYLKRKYDDSAGYISTGVGPEIYIKGDILDNVEKIRYELVLNDTEVLDYTEGHYTMEESDYDLYKTIRITPEFSDYLFEDELNKMINKNSSLSFKFIFYESSGRILKEEIVYLNNVLTQEYGYEDEKIEINKIYVHDSEILFSPVIRLKYNYMSQYDKNTYVVAKWYVGDKLIESYEMTYTPIIDYDLISEDSYTYYGDYSVSLDPMKVKIIVYNNFEDKVELDTLEYTLEEIQ